jgi:hypothetical protein
MQKLLKVASDIGPAPDLASEEWPSFVGFSPTGYQLLQNPYTLRSFRLQVFFDRWVLT